MKDLWEILEYVGETLVFIGVVGEVFAEWREPHRVRLGRISSLILIAGLAMSLAALIGTNEYFNGTIADLNAQAAHSNQLAGEAQLDADNARKETAQLQKDTQGLRTDADEAKRDMVKAQLELAKLKGPPYRVRVIDGAATPDLSKSLTQLLVLRTDGVRVKAPILPPLPKGGILKWTLLLDEDGVGLHPYTLELKGDTTPMPGLVPNSRTPMDFETDSTGRTVLRSVPIVNMPNANKK